MKTCLQSIPLTTTFLGGITGALLLSSAFAVAQTPKCAQDHPGRQHRIESVTKHGDTHMTESIAGHVTKYAIERFGLADLVSEADITRAFDAKTRHGQMVNFLVFKFGGPSAVMVEFLSNGYQHFDNGYSDEAAAILLGLIDFQKPVPDLVMPDWMANYVRETVKDQTKEGISGFLTSKGVPKPLADVIGEKIGEKVAKRVPIAVSFPKKYDVDNRLIELAIEARRKARAGQGPAPTKPQELPKVPPGVARHQALTTNTLEDQP